MKRPGGWRFNLTAAQLQDLINGQLVNPYTGRILDTDRLHEIKSSNIKDVRGLGLWIGLEMTGRARPYCEKLKDEGILCKETHEHVIRFAPPLVIKRDEVDWAVEKVRKVVQD